MPSIDLPIIGSPKKVILEMAFEECGQGGVEKEPEEVASALRKLDAMMLEHPFSALGYVQPDYGSGSAEDLTGFDQRWDQAVSLSLALRIAPREMNGTPLSQDSKAALSRSLSLLHSHVASLAMPSAIMVSAPAGAGNRRRFGFGPIIHEG